MKKSIYKKKFYENNKLYFTVTVILSIILMGFNVYVAILLMNLIDIATSGTMENLVQALVSGVVFMLLNLLFGFIEKHFRNAFYYNASINYKKFVFERMLCKNVNAFNESTTSKYLSALSNDVKSIEINYIEANIALIKQVSLLVGGLVVMLILNPLLFACVIITSLLPVIVSIIFGKSVIKAEKELSDSNERFVGCIKDILSGFSVIKSFKAETEIQDVFNKINEDVEIVKKKRRSTEDTVTIFSGVVGILVLFVVFALGAVLSIKGIMTIGTVVAFIQLLNYVINPIQAIPTLLSKIGGANKLIEKIESHIEDDIGRGGEKELVEFKDNIKFKDVTFGYEEGNDIISGLELIIEKGKSYAIVGVSGSGKSTLLQLLLNYYTNFKGSISIDGVSINDIKSESLYDLLSIIQQNVFIFDGTIEDNITMYKEFSEGKIKYAIEKSGLDLLIDEKGRDYICGENGNKLSGGERQRISIARCLLKETPILMMDEATASLDNSTATMVEKEILGFDGITKIVITHKLNKEILKNYDQIIMIGNGKVIEKGQFDELLEKRGQFYSLYNVSEM